MNDLRLVLEVTGTVQGVGFRPFVHRVATSIGISGEVSNRGGTVSCEIEGERAALEEFIRLLTTEAPPLAVIREVTVREIETTGQTGFSIITSSQQPPGLSSIPPDVATCAACAAETMDSQNRRFGYPFTCCTDCGPRYTVVRDLPYDRSTTSLACFDLCHDCLAEYQNPTDRRFHAQATCCAACGPALTGSTLDEAIDHLRDGDILGVKGVGGYQLLCRADQPVTVQRMRDRKGREEKPFALLVSSIEEAERLVNLDAVGRLALTGPEAPIVLAQGKSQICVAQEVAPGTGLLGVMLPATPLHSFIARGVGVPLVCTSGNRSNEPIIVDDNVAAEAFSQIADAVLSHDRPIERRADDSVGQVVAGRFQLLRRARGFAPRAISLRASSMPGGDQMPGGGQPILGVGAELKSTTCLAIGDQAALSVHLGDLENPAALRAFELAISDQLGLARVEPALIVHDLHPEYLSTKFALAQDMAPTLAVQHHHAHLVSCLIDNHYLGPAIGVTFDGLGWGADGTAWGGEFLVGDASGFERSGHLAAVAMPGGRAAINAPWRMAVSYLVAAFGELPDTPLFSEHEAQLDQVVALSRGDTSLATSSMGRLFDAVAVLCGVTDTVTYEGQAAIGLEHLAANCSEGAYGYEWSIEDAPAISTSALIAAIVEDLAAGVELERIARRFHESVARMVIDVCVRLRESTGINTVALSGGVFQNRLLVELVVPRLTEARFTELRHSQVPPNDGGISLGQVAIGRAHLATLNA